MPNDRFAARPQNLRLPILTSSVSVRDKYIAQIAGLQTHGYFATVAAVVWPLVVEFRANWYSEGAL